MNTIKLGECPFCNSRVTADLETADGMVMAGLPECENGCPVGRVISPAALTTSMSDTPERLADKWTQACDMLLNPETCPICDEHPVFTAIKADLWFGCPSDGLVKATAGMSLVKLVEEWNTRVAEVEQTKRRQAELEAECAILNRAYWPDRFKDEWD